MGFMTGTGSVLSLDAISFDELAQRLTALAGAGEVDTEQWITIQEELARRRVAVAQQASVPRIESLRSQIINFLSTRPNSTPSQIAEALDRSTTVVSRVLANLLQAHLVIFEPSVDDGRLRLYRLAEHHTPSDDGKVVPPSAAEEERQYLGLVIDSAVRARRRNNDLGYAADRFSRVLQQASASNIDDLALIARCELVTTLRQQGGKTEEMRPHLAALGEMATGKTAVAAHLVAPAAACLDYELGRLDTCSERARLEHLTTAATEFHRCKDIDETQAWASREGWARLAIAELWRQKTEFGAALPEAKRAESVFLRYDDTYGSAEATRIQGFCERLRGNFHDAIEVLRRALRYAEDSSADRCRADVLLQLGDALRCTGDLKPAAEVLSEAIELAGRLDRPRTLGFSLSALSAVNYAANDLDKAWELATEAQPHMASSPPGLALNARRRGVIARELVSSGKTVAADRSLELFRESMRRYRDLESPAGVAACYVGMGKLTDVTHLPDEPISGLINVACSEVGRLLLPIDPWVPGLVSQWADESDITDVKRVADWTYTSNRQRESADEMAGEPRLKALLSV